LNSDCKRPDAADPAGPAGIFSDARFEDMGLVPALLKGVKEAGFERCTPIQAQALPLALAGRDVAGQARTGTGKTAAFLIAAMDRVLRGASSAEEAGGGGTAHEDGREASADSAPAGGRGGPPCRPRIYIVAPTRELAIQIHKDAVTIGRHTGLAMGVVYGGTGYDRQRRMIEEGLDILIGTPGRLIDYHRQRLYDLRSVEVFVLDEADRMFDLGFIRDIRYLFRRLRPPAERLSFLFSATLSQRVLELAYEHMNEATLIDTRPPDRVVVDEVTQRLFHVGQDEKIPLLLGLLREPEVERAMVFVNTRQMADRLGAALEGNGFAAAVLSGDVPQRRRLALLESFHEGRISILVATDVAARGLHIPGVTHVFNYDLPQDPEDYVHRIGRTARVGAKGEAVSLACDRFVYSLADIEELLGTRIPTERVEESMLVEPRPSAPLPKNRRRAGHREKRPRGGRGRRRAAGNAAPRPGA
jgi:ATP-dependent RNA helicase RhlB